MIKYSTLKRKSSLGHTSWSTGGDPLVWICFSLFYGTDTNKKWKFGLQAKTCTCSLQPSAQKNIFSSTLLGNTWLCNINYLKQDDQKINISKSTVSLNNQLKLLKTHYSLCGLKNCPTQFFRNKMKILAKYDCKINLHSINHCLIWSCMFSFMSGPSISRIFSLMDTSACQRRMEKEFKHDELIPKTYILSLEIIVVILQVWHILTKTRSQGQSNIIFCFTNLIFKAIFVVIFLTWTHLLVFPLMFLLYNSSMLLGKEIIIICSWVRDWNQHHKS